MVWTDSSLHAWYKSTINYKTSEKFRQELINDGSIAVESVGDKSAENDSEGRSTADVAISNSDIASSSVSQEARLNIHKVRTAASKKGDPLLFVSSHSRSLPSCSVAGEMPYVDRSRSPPHSTSRHFHSPLVNCHTQYSRSRPLQRSPRHLASHHRARAVSISPRRHVCTRVSPRPSRCPCVVLLRHVGSFLPVLMGSLVTLILLRVILPLLGMVVVGSRVLQIALLLIPLISIRLCVPVLLQMVFLLLVGMILVVSFVMLMVVRVRVPLLEKTRWGAVFCHSGC